MKPSKKTKKPVPGVFRINASLKDLHEVMFLSGIHFTTSKNACKVITENPTSLKLWWMNTPSMADLEEVRQKAKDLCNKVIE